MYVDSCTINYTHLHIISFQQGITENKEFMLRKLERLRFMGTINNYFRDYLSNRKVHVKTVTTSYTKTNNIGLPKGSVTASWFFSLYINDMNRVSTKFKFAHFADDSTVYMVGDNLEILC